ncbi:hypothetical protein GmHk_04G010334 [Glycine max]|nr:hypothetical protein GmHk_04G010334 [Glycine max]
MKADMEAMKEQMATMMEAMMSMKKIMKANAVAIAATSVVAKVNPMPPSGLNQMNHPTSDMVGKDFGSTGDPHYAQIQNKHAFPPYGLPSNYTSPNVAYTPSENTHEIPHHNLADFEPCLGYATEGQVVGGILLQNTLEGLQFRPQPQSLHSTIGKIPPIMEAMGKVERPSSPGGTPNIEKGDDNRDSRHITNGGLHTFNFADLVFADERIKVGLKRGKFNHPAWTNEKIGANEEGENEGETHAVTAVPIWKLPHQLNKHHYSANISPSHYPPPSHPQRPSLNQPQNLSTAFPMTNTTFSTNQNTNQEMNFAAKKPIEFTLILVSYADLLPYLLDNAMVAITAARVPQPPFFQGYDSNATCAYHGGVLGHSIEHCITSKRKVQSLINAGWLKVEENHL